MRKSQITYLELDVLKPHLPSLPEFLLLIRNVEGIRKVQASLLEMDNYTENIKLIVDSNNLEYERLKDCITAHKGTIHSIDRVILEIIS
jgi:hypothetical protein